MTDANGRDILAVPLGQLKLAHHPLKVTKELCEEWHSSMKDGESDDVQEIHRKFYENKCDQVLWPGIKF